MKKIYKYEKPAFTSKRSDAVTAAFAGGGWLHLKMQPCLPSRFSEDSPVYLIKDRTPGRDVEVGQPKRERAE